TECFWTTPKRTGSAFRSLWGSSKRAGSQSAPASNRSSRTISLPASANGSGKSRLRSARGTRARDAAPALDVDEVLASARAGRPHGAARPRRCARNAHAAAEVDALSGLALLHEPGDLDLRSLVRFDLRDQLLRPAHAQVHSFRNGGTRRILGAGAGSENHALRASGDEHAHGVFRDGLFFLIFLLSANRPAQHGGDDEEGRGLHLGSPCPDCLPFSCRRHHSPR